MKKILLSLIVFGYFVSNAQVGIGVSSANMDSSAQLEVASTTMGFLPPRMTYAQRIAISTPAVGLMVYCTDCGTNGGEPQYFNGSTWFNMIGDTASTPPTPVPSIPSTTIGSQIWTTENLNVSNYNNGDPIPQVTDPSLWSNLTTGAWCWYNNDSATYAAVYGKVYNWYAVNDSRGIAPIGWRIPTIDDWATLETSLGGASVAGGKMKTTGTTHWNSPNTGADNSSGFSGIGSGYRYLAGAFDRSRVRCYFWSITEFSTTNAACRLLYSNASNSGNQSALKTYGMYVRCVKDLVTQ
jgi:uncharacterized protein (TIGR02145 family)